MSCLLRVTNFDRLVLFWTISPLNRWGPSLKVANMSLCFQRRMSAPNRTTVAVSNAVSTRWAATSVPVTRAMSWRLTSAAVRVSTGEDSQQPRSPCHLHPKALHTLSYPNAISTVIRKHLKRSQQSGLRRWGRCDFRDLCQNNSSFISVLNYRLSFGAKC